MSSVMICRLIASDSARRSFTSVMFLTLKP
jgi:hypothetical protein